MKSSCGDNDLVQTRGSDHANDANNITALEAYGDDKFNRDEWTSFRIAWRPCE